MNIKAIDAEHCWHPFTQAHSAPANLYITKSEGIYLYDENNQAYIDAIASWWVVTHGHNHPDLIQALQEQSKQLSHVLFSGITHKPASLLAKALLNMANQTHEWADLASKQIIKTIETPYQWVFYSDNGSTAIEAAMKMACQYHYNQKNYQKTKQTQTINQQTDSKKRFVAFEGAYHGDTFGAMAIGKTSGFYNAFEPWLLAVDFLPYPSTEDFFTGLNLENEALNTTEQNCLQQAKSYFQNHHQEIIAFIFEPLVQGANGMRMCRPIFLQALLRLAKEYKILTIADEVMTGFGRTGSMLACHQLGIKPDIICLSKGITGGVLPLGATLVQDFIYQAFKHTDVMAAFLHGHSYTANALACSVALANLQVFIKENTVSYIQTIHQWHKQALLKLQNTLQIHGIEIQAVRCYGSIAAFDLKHFNQTYGSTQTLRLACLKHGLILRPLGQCVYILTPYCIKEDELNKIYEILENVLIDTIHKNSDNANKNNTKDLF